MAASTRRRLGPSAACERIARLSGRGVDEQVGALRGGPKDSSSCRRKRSSGRAVGQGTAACLVGSARRSAERTSMVQISRSCRANTVAGDRDAAPADRESLRRLRRVRRRGVGRSGEALRHHQLADLPGRRQIYLAIGQPFALVLQCSIAPSACPAAEPDAEQPGDRRCVRPVCRSLSSSCGAGGGRRCGPGRHQRHQRSWGCNPAGR